MQDQEAQTQDWQQPQQSTVQTPYQPVTQTVESDIQPMETEVYAQTSDAMAEQQFDQPNMEEIGAADSQDDEILVQWQASEYPHRDHTPAWYAGLGVVTVLLVLVAIFVFDSISFAILIPVMAVALVIYVHRPPAIIDYVVSRKGLYVNDRLFPYDQFKSFGIITREDVNYAVLIPRKRFQMGQRIYFPREVGEQLVDMLAARLPMKEIHPDAIDKLLAKLQL